MIVDKVFEADDWICRFAREAPFRSEYCWNAHFLTTFAHAGLLGCCVALLQGVATVIAVEFVSFSR